jgi:hypothetical protein
MLVHKRIAAAQSVGPNKSVSLRSSLRAAATKNMTHTLIAQISKRISVKPNGCWEWEGYKNAQGYGIFRRKRKHYLSHRSLFNELVYPVYPGEDVHHLCENTSCCNPSHLTVLLSGKHAKVNPRNPTTINSKKESCHVGHPLSGKNLKLEPWKRGIRRRCRLCNTLYIRKRHERNSLSLT